MSRRNRQENPISLFSFQDIVTSVTGILILLAIMLAISVITQGATPAGQTETVDARELQETKSRLEEMVKSLEVRMKSNQAAVNSWLGATKEELEQQQASYQAAARITEESIRRLQSEVARTDETVKQFIADPEVQATNALVQELKKKLAEAQKELDALRSGSRVFYNFRTGDRTAWMVQITGGEILACRANERAKAKVFRTAGELLTFARGLPASEQYLVLVVRPSGLAAFDQIKEQCDEEEIDVGVELIGEQQVVVDREMGAAGK
jgi:predicted RNase H-like nuclease (RuvC/YqgF family)